MRNHAFILMLLLLMISGLSCSKGDSPVGTPNQPADQENRTLSAAGSHRLLSYTLVSYDPATMDFQLIPLRQVVGHWNVLTFLEQGPCTDCVSIVNTQKTLNNNLLVSVQIKHPFAIPSYTGFDVRGIVIFKGTQTFTVSGLKTSSALKGEGELIDPDGYTTLYNPTTVAHAPLQGYLKGKLSAGLPDSTLNGYMTFNSPGAENTRDYFLAGASITSNFQIHQPNGPFIFGYAVDASWVPPDVKPVHDPNTDFPPNANCSEPYKITMTEVPTGSGLTDKGGNTTLNMNIYDHQGKDSYYDPTVECPDLFTGTKTATWVEQVGDYDTWTVVLDNTKLAKAGRYKVLIAVEDKDNDSSPDWLNLTAYQVYTVMVTPDTSLKGWAVTFGGMYEDQALSSVTDSAGNVYVVGFFSGDTDFDPGPGEAIRTAEEIDAFLAKYDASGKYVWVGTWGAEYDDYATNVTLSGSNILVYGLFEETVDFDPGTGTDLHTSNGGNDFFLNVFDTNGVHKWAVTWGSSNSEYAGGMGVDASGKIYFGGTIGSMCDFDPGPGTHEVDPVGWTCFLLKLDSYGQFIWVKTWNTGDYSDNLVGDISVTPSGSVWVCGYFEDTGDFNPGPSIDMHSSLGYHDAFVSRFDAAGNFKWAKTWGEADDDDIARAVVPDALGNCYITGSFAYTVDFDPGPGTVSKPSYGDIDAFILELDQNGSYKWVGTMGGIDYDSGNGIAIDLLGNIYIAGEFAQTADLNPGPTQSNRVSNGWLDAFLVKLSPSNQFLWADTWGGTDGERLGSESYYEYGNPVWVDIYGKSYVAGEFRQTCDFNPGTGVDNHIAYQEDAFITTVPPTGSW